MTADENVRKMLDANRELWDRRTKSHIESDFYDVTGFLLGKSSLNSYELDLVGDVHGKSLLHLQCHFGQDTLSFARMGANVVGVDFSPAAIEAANHFKAELDLKADFHCCNVYDTREVVSHMFDIVFSSYGTIGWLPDLTRWAMVIAESLSPGGVFVFAEFHPFVWMLDDQFVEIEHSYFNERVIETITKGSYTGSRQLHEPLIEYGWNHPLSDVLSALLNAGLSMEVFREYAESPYDCFPGMERLSNGRFQFKRWPGKLPLVYSLRMRKPND
jgi:SAM-dependent methyltransferase